MKGVILAGGEGSRLFPCTKVTNKHLLPVFNKPMIYYPIETLKNSGIQDILIISGPEHAGDFMQLLGSGLEFNVNFTYKIQDGSGGIAQALSLAEGFANNESVAVILSDNIFENSFSEEIFYFQKGAQIFCKEVEDPSRFGVVDVREDGSIRSIEEKPAFPKSKLAQTGFYLFDNQVFDFIKQIQPSKRGELEITDVNNIYLERKQLKYHKLEGAWIDAGTHESLLEASIIAQEAFEPGRKVIQKHRSKNLEQTKNNTPKVTIGLLTHNSEKYISSCLTSLLGQNYENTEIIILDNHSVDKTKSILAKEFPQIRVLKSDKNKGFGAGHNQILNESEGELYACLNIDMIFEPNFITQLVKAIEEKPTYGSVGGKIKRWDFEGFESHTNSLQEMGKTNFIDSIGIRFLKSHKFEDIGQGEVDYGQFDHKKEVFGISGAAILLRRKALEDIAFKEGESPEYFDTSMFMYKEDVDLAYRLQWAGWKSQYSPQAVAFHDRTISAIGNSAFDIIKNRQKKSSKINQLSYLNHQILIRKNFSEKFSREIKNATFFYNLKIFLYLLFFETETLGQWWKIYRLSKKIKSQREAMPKRVSQKDLEKLMEA